ncbi:MAG TPA: lysylphosphatidylglycerol synthase domain-containing protein [Steroidobacteraceae bacterium]|jgi:putative membrane protein
MFRAPKFRLAVLALVGCALAVYILERIGLKPILSAAAAVGWRGFTILCVYQLLLFVLLGTAWNVLIPASCGSRAPVFIWARMVRDATSELLPFSHLGGIVLSARTAMFHGVPRQVAIGSMVTDVTTEMLAQILFTAAGVGILTTSTPHNSLTFSIASTAVLGLAAIVLSCSAFVAFQRYGQAFTTRLISRLFPSAASAAESVAACIAEIYRRPANVCLSVLLHCGGWAATALSTWIALVLMGVDAHFWPVFAIESLVCAARSMAFLVPSGLGVQEVAYAAIAPLFGIGAEIGLAISVLKRAREIAVGLPILLLFQWTEGRNFLSYKVSA